MHVYTENGSNKNKTRITFVSITDSLVIAGSGSGYCKYRVSLDGSTATTPIPNDYCRTIYYKDAQCASIIPQKYFVLCTQDDALCIILRHQTVASPPTKSNLQVLISI